MDTIGVLVGKTRTADRVGELVALGVTIGVAVAVGSLVEVAAGTVGVFDGAGVWVNVGLGARVAAGIGVSIGLGITAAGVRASKASAAMITIKPITSPPIKPANFQ